MAALRLSGVELIDLPDTDKAQGEGCCDPFVAFTLYDSSGGVAATTRTTTIHDVSDVLWREDFMIELPSGCELSKCRLVAAVWDDDGTMRETSNEAIGTDDEAVGSLNIRELDPDGGSIVKATVVPGDRTLYAFRMSFSYRPIGLAEVSAFKEAAVAREVERLAKETAARAAAEKAAKAARAAADEAARRAAAEAEKASRMEAAGREADAAAKRAADAAADAAAEAAAARAAERAASMAKVAARQALAEAGAALQESEDAARDSALAMQLASENAAEAAEEAARARKVAEEAAARAKHAALDADDAVKDAARAIREANSQLAVAQAALEMAAEKESVAKQDAEQQAAKARAAAEAAEAAKAEQRRREDLADKATKVIRIKSISATGLPDYDKEMGDGASDPYVKVTLQTEEGRTIGSARTLTVPNARNVQWDETLELTVQGDFATGKLKVAVFDDDTMEGGRRDEIMGQLTLGVESEGGGLDRATVIAADKSRYSFQLSLRYGGFPEQTAERLAAIRAAEDALVTSRRAAEAAAAAAAAHAVHDDALAAKVAALKRVAEAAAAAKAAEEEALAKAQKAADLAARAAAAAQEAAKKARAAAAAAGMPMGGDEADAAARAAQAIQDAKEAFAAAQAALAAAELEEAAAALASKVALARAKAAAAQSVAAEAKAAALEAARLAARRMLFVYGIEAIELPDYDKEMGKGASDPYVAVTLETVDGRPITTVCTKTEPNSRNVRCLDELELECSRATPTFHGLPLTIHDLPRPPNDLP